MLLLRLPETLNRPCVITTKRIMLWLINKITFNSSKRSAKYKLNALNVLCWHGSLLERSLSRACVGGFLLARGGGQNTPGHRDCLRINCGHVFANTVRSWGQMAPGRTPRVPAVALSACLGQLWDNLAIFGFLEAICAWYLTVFARTCPPAFRLGSGKARIQA